MDPNSPTSPKSHDHHDETMAKVRPSASARARAQLISLSSLIPIPTQSQRDLIFTSSLTNTT